MLNSKWQAEHKEYKNDSKFVYVHEMKILQPEAVYKFVADLEYISEVSYNITHMLDHAYQYVY
jgi:hypothetical protein